MYFSDASNDSCLCMNRINALWLSQFDSGEDVLRNSASGISGVANFPDVIRMDPSNDANYEFMNLYFCAWDGLPCKFNGQKVAANIYYSLSDTQIDMRVDIIDYVLGGLYPANPTVLMTCDLKFTK